YASGSACSKRLFASLGVLVLLLASCESKPAAPPPAEPKTETPTAAKTAEPVSEPEPLPEPESAQLTKGFSVAHHEDADLRLVSYNILWNHIFEDVSPSNAAKFARLITALDPDILALQEIGVHPRDRNKPGVKSRTAEEVRAVMNEIAPLPDGASWHAFQGYDNVIVSKYPLKETRTSTIPKGQRDLAIALVDLPDEDFNIDFYVLNNHYKCCNGEKNDPKRQQQSDAIVSWLRDARTPGGEIDLPAGTAFAVVGDLNIVGSFQPVQTLIEGDIIDEEHYGKDFPLDWDDTSLVDPHPRHNIAGPDDYTWRNDHSDYEPGRIDFIIYTDSVLAAVQTFVLNTTTMSNEDLRAAGLQRRDICADTRYEDFDHLPLVADFRVVAGE
ncbi:MAG: endonuclease/exonuclease/phosphatase family protein, partial [Phycisphaerae bacterium]|nr:endonuclease/exonuclease/phosphatase family protein [Phycisphaerae bacterium]